MLTLIHGDDTAASRTFYLEVKKKSESPVTLEADKINLTDIVQVLTGGGLFGEEKHVFIESLLSKKKKSPELSAILTELEHTDSDIYLWEGKEIDKRTISSLKNVKNHIFKLPESLFQFLDSLAPGNPQMIRLYHQNLNTLEPEFLFSMLIRQLRLLLAVSSPVQDEIEELKRMSWQRAKLQKQSRTFGEEALKKHYRKLYEIDLAQKTGTLPIPLSSAIDFWLLEL
jgi:DNA polymerase III delta subunit